MHRVPCGLAVCLCLCSFVASANAGEIRRAIVDAGSPIAATAPWTTASERLSVRAGAPSDLSASRFDLTSIAADNGRSLATTASCNAANYVLHTADQIDVADLPPLALLVQLEPGASRTQVTMSSELLDTAQTDWIEVAANWSVGALSPAFPRSSDLSLETFCGVAVGFALAFGLLCGVGGLMQTA